MCLLLLIGKSFAVTFYIINMFKLVIIIIAIMIIIVIIMIMIVIIIIIIERFMSEDIVSGSLLPSCGGPVYSRCSVVPSARWRPENG